MMIALTPRIPICRTAQYFNPHFRKGSDRAAAIYRMPGKYFNPHFRKGSDRWGMMRKRYLQISIHTSAREVTNEDIRQAIRFIISIHTSAREVTLDCAVFFSITTISIHTSAREVTASSMRTYRIARFQSTLPQGK